MNNILIDHIHLIGSVEENFYILGRKDAGNFGQVYTHMMKLATRSEHISSILKKGTEVTQYFIRKKKNEYMNQISAYADGLERPIEEVYFSLLLPELISAFNKWTPNFLSMIPGCSSLFQWDEKTNSVLHGRILDYAVVGPFENNERIIQYEFPGAFKITSFSTAAMPYPAITAVNEKGLTLAIHHKHGEYFDLDGHSIFYIGFKVLSHCSEVSEIKKFLTQYPSMSYWGMYFSDKNGNILSLDICGADIYQEKFDLKEHDYLYFNNRPLIQDKENIYLAPYGNHNQCKMRFKYIKELYNKSPNQPKNLNNILKALTQYSEDQGDSATDWKLQPITPTSVQAVAINSSDFSAEYITGLAPKNYDNEIIKINNLMGNLSLESVPPNNEQFDKKYSKGYRHLALAQTYFDTNEMELAYHHMQLSINHLKNYPIVRIVEFYFAVWQYLYTEEKKMLGFIYEQFSDLEDKLPTYLEDQRKLFILRLEKQLGKEYLNQVDEIQNKQLKAIYLKEYKLKPFAINLLKKLTYPRIDILDVIYSY